MVYLLFILIFIVGKLPSGTTIVFKLQKPMQFRFHSEIEQNLDLVTLKTLFPDRNGIIFLTSFPQTLSVHKCYFYKASSTLYSQVFSNNVIADLPLANEFFHSNYCLKFYFRRFRNCSSFYIFLQLIYGSHCKFH